MALGLLTPVCLFPFIYVSFILLFMGCVFLARDLIEASSRQWVRSEPRTEAVIRFVSMVWVSLPRRKLRLCINRPPHVLPSDPAFIERLHAPSGGAVSADLAGLPLSLRTAAAVEFEFFTLKNISVRTAFYGCIVRKHCEENLLRSIDVLKGNPDKKNCSKTTPQRRG